MRLLDKIAVYLTQNKESEDLEKIQQRNDRAIAKKLKELVDLGADKSVLDNKLKTQWMSYSKLGKAKIFVEIFDGEREYIKPCKIVDEYYVQFKIYGKKRKTLITWHPKVLEVPYFFMGFLPRTRRGLVFHCGAMAEATHDPARASLDIHTISSANQLAETVIKEKTFEGLNRAIKKTAEWIHLVYFFGLAITIILMQYFSVQ